jgi:nucleoside-diphosphate-sugar epimerase
VTVERILVTGLGGAVGTELAGRLTELTASGAGVELVGVFSSQRSRQRFLASAGPALRLALRAEVCDLIEDREVARLAADLGRAERTVLVHAAANTSWTLPRNEAMAANVHATKNIAELVRHTSDRARMIYVSSAYAAIDKWDYRNTYEESKAFAERMLRADYADLDPSVFACSLVVGHSRTGSITRYHGLYPLLRLIESYEVPVVPGGREHRLDIVPVDWVADELLRLLIDVRDGLPARDVVASAGDAAPMMPELVTAVVAALNRRRMREGRRLIGEIAILGFRQWEFLRRSIDVWQVKRIPMPNPRVLELMMSTYRPYLEDDQVLPPRGTASPAPLWSSYVDQVVSFWLDRVARSGRIAKAA